MVGKFSNLFAQLSLYFLGMSQNALHGVVFGQKFGRRFFPDGGNAGDVIHRIAHEAKHVYDLIHPLNPPAVADLLNPEHFRRITPAARLEDFHFFGDQLAKVFVRGHHVDLVACRFSLMCQGSNDIVRLEARNAEGGNLHGFKQLVDIGNGHFDALRGLVSVRFVRREELLANLATANVKHNRDMAGLLLFQNIQQGQHEAIDGRRVHPLAIDPGISSKGKIGSKYQGIGIEEIETGHGHGKEISSKIRPLRTTFGGYVVLFGHHSHVQ